MRARREEREMTSKEALNDLFSGEIIRLNSYMDLRLGIIKEDLEILELIRKYMYFDKKDNCIKMFYIKECITNFDFEILQEWLENDK